VDAGGRRWAGRAPEMGVDFNFRPTVDLVGAGDCQEILDALAAKVLPVIREFKSFF
jgi:hypothetical protein